MIIGYLEDGSNLVTMAMNGWADGEPAWWLNLQAHPEASVDLADGRLAVRGRAAEGRNGRDCGPGGANWTRTWTATRRFGPLSPLLWSWSLGPTRTYDAPASLTAVSLHTLLSTSLTMPS